MSINLSALSARLTVLGSGWNNSSINSGSGLTEDGKLMEDVAEDLGYESGENVDWDNLAGNRNWADEIYTDEEGNKYIPESTLIDLKAFLEQIHGIDRVLMQYSIKPNDLKNIYGGPVSQESTWDQADTARPHSFTPTVYYVQVKDKVAYLFLDEVFYHKTADSGSLEVSDKTISIRDGSSLAVYYSKCSTTFDTNYLPAPYNTYPIEYVCWQCLWGSFSTMLVHSNDKAATEEDITSGKVYPKKTINGKPYYLIQMY